MIKNFYFIFLSLTISFTLTAQDYSVTNHSYENFHDFPTDIFFAEDADSSIWVLQHGGFTGVVISKYSNDSWESIPFDGCQNCSYNIASDINGVIYLSTNVGFFAFENDQWTTKSGDIIARSDFVFDSNNNLWFRHDDGSVENLAFMDPSGAVTVIPEVVGDIGNLTIADDGKIWFRNNMQVVSYDGTTVERFDLNINHIDIASDNKLWFADFSGAIGVLENGNNTENLYPDLSTGIAHTSMATDRNTDHMWLGIQGIDAGIGLLNLNNGNYTFIDAEEIYIDAIGLSYTTFVSSTGSLWVATRFEPQVAEIVSNIIIGTDDIFETVSVYPNPVSTEIFIEKEIEQLSNNISFEVFNHLGQLIATKPSTDKGSSQRIDVSDLPRGWYMLRSNALRLQSSFIKF